MHNQPKPSQADYSNENNSQEAENISARHKSRQLSLAYVDDKVAQSMPVMPLKVTGNTNTLQAGPLTRQENVVYSHISPNKHQKKDSYNTLSGLNPSIRSKSKEESHIEKTEKSKIRNIEKKYSRTRAPPVGPMRYFSSL